MWPNLGALHLLYAKLTYLVRLKNISVTVSVQGTHVCKTYCILISNYILPQLLWFNPRFDAYLILTIQYFCKVDMALLKPNPLQV